MRLGKKAKSNIKTISTNTTTTTTTILLLHVTLGHLGATTSPTSYN